MRAPTCPRCGTHDLASRPPERTAAGAIHCAMTCEDCGATWIAVYHCVQVRDVRAEPGEAQQPPQEEGR